MADLQRQARTAAVQTAVEDQRPADAPVPGGHTEQVTGAPAGPVPVFGERHEVDIVAAEADLLGDSRDAGLGERAQEEGAYGGAPGPGEVQRVEGLAVRFGDRRGHRETGAEAAPSGLAQQVGAGRDDVGEHMRRVGGDGAAAGRGRHDAAAEADQRDPEPVRVDLCGEHDRSALGDEQPVGGPPLGAGRGGRPGVDGDQSERFELGGHRSRGRAGHAEFGGQDGAGGRTAGVYELQCGSEGAAAPLQPGCPSLGHTPILTLCRR